MLKSSPFSLLLFILLTFVVAPIFGQAPSINWQVKLGGSLNEEANSVIETRDHGFIAVGSTHSSDGDVVGNHGNEDVWVVKLNSIGNVQWKKCLGGDGSEGGIQIIQTNDDGYFILASAAKNNGQVSGCHGESDIWGVKLDSLGNIDWQRGFGGSDFETPHSICNSVDGGIIVAGQSTSANGDLLGLTAPGFWRTWLFKLSITGTIVWNMRFDSDIISQVESMQELPDGGLIMTGSTQTGCTHGSLDLVVVRLDSAQNMLWNKCYGGILHEIGYSVKQTADGGFAIGGWAGSNDGDVAGNHGGADMWVLKIDGSGSLVWQKCIGGSNQDFGHDMVLTADGGYLLTGYTQSNDGDVSGNHGAADAWLVKLDSIGNFEWQKCYGGTLGELIYGLASATSDGGFVFAGQSNSTDGDFAGGNADANFLVVKVGGIVSSEEAALEVTVSIYPNPVRDHLMLDFQDGNLGSKYQVVISDLFGRTILQSKIDQNPFRLAVPETIGSGVYLLQILDVFGNIRAVRKLLKE